MPPERRKMGDLFPLPNNLNMQTCDNCFNALSIAKVIMVIGIIYIHIFPSFALRQICSSFPSFNHIYAVITETLARGCVPFYFFISGFMYAKGELRITNYKRKTLSRVNRLIIPFFIWNTLFLIFFCLDRVQSVTDFIWLYIRPANFPLWFLRDLFLVSLTAPIISFCISKLKNFFPLFLLSTYFIYMPESETSFIASLIFFSIGVFFSTRTELMNWTKTHKAYIFAIFFLLWSIDTILYLSSYNRLFIHNLFKLWFILTFVCLLPYLRKDKKIGNFLFSLGNFSFFLYCTHLFFIAIPHLLYPAYYNCSSLFSSIAIFLCSPWLLCVSSYTVYYILLKINPELLHFLLGTKKHH